ncbi:Fur family transcriptional regulator [Ancylobacter lacus]|uniref:Fur family transcriptional regulator n=1 Tax=Ancylobacter lacus TaxID=2579970 RepID=UPI001BCB27C8|nr:Fur family transcriptional regulator [Ancylobacter lacus]MBS7541051.1 transcriptional repressor [Ancylobacter lacus]
MTSPDPTPPADGPGRLDTLDRDRPGAADGDVAAGDAAAGHDHDHDHDHGSCVSGALARAQACCAARGMRLTPLRRRVLESLADSHVPLGAYELVGRLGASGDRPPPMSVYRALDFLVAEGLAHRIESRNAFIVCGREHGADDVVVFLICESCGATAEVASHAIGRDLAWATRAAGFTPRNPVIEIAGTCAKCQSAAEAPGPEAAGAAAG